MSDFELLEVRGTSLSGDAEAFRDDEPNFPDLMEEEELPGACDLLAVIGGAESSTSQLHCV